MENMKNVQLYHTLCEKIKEYMKNKQIKIDGVKLGEIPIYFFEYKLRTLEKQNYKVFMSKELGENPKYLDYKEVIEKIKIQAQNAEDLNKYLSRGIKNIQEPDRMLNDWGVMHMHLSNEIENDGCVKRTDDLLFLFRQSNELYFLDIFEHKNAWTRKRTMEILTNNWNIVKPMGFEPDSLMVKPSEEDIKALRDAGINTPFIVGNEAYMSTGGGMTTVGTNIESTFKKNDIMKFMARLEKALGEDNIQNVKMKVNDDGIEIIAGEKIYRI